MNIDNTSSEAMARLEVPEMNKIIGKNFPVLDHGFIRVVDYMGGDAAIVQAARVSYGKGTKKTSEDRGLIRYLMKHRHTTPFEMCELKVHVKLPIFVARQWIRHRTASVNEYSARYSIMDKEFYIPDNEYLKGKIENEKFENKKQKENEIGQQSIFSDSELGIETVSLKYTAQQSSTNKQGRGDTVDEDEAAAVLKEIKRVSNSAYTVYEKLMNENIDGKKLNSDKKGVARELARMVLPTNYYTQWYWKINLHNLFHFIALREDSHAQYEIRVYAQILNDIVKKWVPFAWEAFEDYRHNAVSLSSQEFELIKSMLHNKDISELKKNLSDRELRELRGKLELTDLSI